MQVPIGKIQIKEGRRSLDAGHVKELADSIRELGLLNPLTIDRDYVLIAGLHRLEAVKALGWEDVECTVSSLEGLAAELAEIDENIVRSDISTLEYGEILLRRKEIYEMLHPETKEGIAQAISMNRTLGNNVSDKMSLTSKSFVQVTAEKLGVVPRTIERQIQTAKNLTPETKEIIKKSDQKISKEAALKLSRLGPEQQKEAAALLAAKEIRTVDEYTAKVKGAQEAEIPAQSNLPDRLPEPQYIEPVADKPVEAEPPAPAGDCPLQTGHAASLKDVVAELKDPDKDCSGTPDSFLAEYEAFTRKFHKEIGWYNDPYYDTVFPSVSPEQLASLRELTDSICLAAEELFHKVERTMKNEQLQKKT